MYRLDRKGKTGGGLALCINSRWKSCLCNDLMKSDFSESLWCTISTGYGVLLVGLCCRSPSSVITNDRNLLNLFELAADYKCCTDVMIMGDFNYPAIDFANQSVNSGCTSAAFQFSYKCQSFAFFSTSTNLHDLETVNNHHVLIMFSLVRTMLSRICSMNHLSVKATMLS